MLVLSKTGLPKTVSWSGTVTLRSNVIYLPVSSGVPGQSIPRCLVGFPSIPRKMPVSSRELVRGVDGGSLGRTVLWYHKLSRCRFDYGRLCFTSESKSTHIATQTTERIHSHSHSTREFSGRSMMNSRWKFDVSSPRCGEVEEEVFYLRGLRVCHDCRVVVQDGNCTRRMGECDVLRHKIS